MSLTRIFKTDNAKEVQGVPIRVGVNVDGTQPTFYVSRASRANPRYLAALERVLGPHRAAMDRKALPEGFAAKLMRQVFIEGALTNWENIPKSDVQAGTDAEGYAEFNDANAETLFDNLPELFALLESKANEIALFRVEELETDAKN